MWSETAATVPPAQIPDAAINAFYYLRAAV